MKKIFIILTFILLGFSFLYYKSYSLASKQDDLKNLFQKYVDKNFKDIDKEAFEYLARLNKEKNYCFGANKKKNFLECSDELEKVFGPSGKFLVSYKEACNKSLEETIKDQKDKSIGAKKALELLDPYSGLCTRLADFKVNIYKETGYDILKNNKYHVLKDENKKFIQVQRTRYDRVLELFRIVLGNGERITDSWPSKTKKHILQ